MEEILTQYWWLIAAAFVIGLLVVWLVLSANRKTRVEIDTRDVLDEDAGPSQRNQALIDAPPAAADAPQVPPTKAEPEPVPAASPAPAPKPAATSAADDLTQIKGLGPKLRTTLADLGVTSFAQIAAWDDAEIDRIDAQLGRFEGRIRRDSWVEQAKLLAVGDADGFSAKFGAN